MRTRAAAVAVCLAVSLAGCSGPAGVFGTDAGTPVEATETPAPVPGTTPTPTPELDLAAGDVAPGLTDDGVRDAAELARAHADAWRETPHRTVLTRTVTANGTERANLTVVSEVDRPAAHATVRLEGEADVGTPLPVDPGAPYSERYADRDSIHVLTVDGDTRSVERMHRTAGIATPGGVPSVSNRLLLLYHAFEDVSVRRAGPGRYRLGSESVGSGFARSEGVAAVENATFVAAVDRRGGLQAYRLTYTAETVDGDRVRVEERLDYGAAGETTVERPDWADDGAA